MMPRPTQCQTVSPSKNQIKPGNVIYVRVKDGEFREQRGHLATADVTARVSLKRGEALNPGQGGIGQDQGHGIGLANILSRSPHQAPGDEQRILPTLQHSAEPVERDRKSVV